MTKADHEVQTIISTLSHIFWSNTDPKTGITHKPYGVDWINFERNMHRLLILRGMVKQGEKVPGDPWEMFLREFGPKNAQRPASARQQPSNPYFPSSILRPSSGNGEHLQPQEGSLVPEQHVRFEVPPTPRSRENRHLSGPIPRSFS